MDGSTKYKTVSILGNIKEIIYFVIENTLLLFYTSLTGNAAGYGLIADPEDLGIYALLVQSFSHFRKRCVSAAFLMWASIYQ
jgi:hypothetical protein